MINTSKQRAILVALTLLLSACNWGRTPSNIRFPKNCHINLPKDVTVLKDEYEGMGSDYAIYYTVKLTNPEMKKLIYQIEQTYIYHSSPPSNATDSASRLLEEQYPVGAWYKVGSSLKFIKTGRTTIQAQLDSAKATIEFEEYGG